MSLVFNPCLRFSPYRVHLEERIEAFAETSAFRHTDLVTPLASGPIPVRPAEGLKKPPPPTEPHPDDVAAMAASEVSAASSGGPLGATTTTTSVTCKYQAINALREIALAWYYVHKWLTSVGLYRLTQLAVWEMRESEIKSAMVA